MPPIRQATIRIQERQIEEVEAAAIAIRDEYVKLDLIREATVRLLAEATRVRGDVAQCEDRLKKSVERMILAILAMRSDDPRGAERRGANGGEAPL